MGRKKAEETMEEEVVETETVETEEVVETEDAPVDTRNKRTIIAEAIEAGGATIDTLQEVAACSYASVMSAFSMLRLMGKCPVKDVDVDVPVLDESGDESYDDAGNLVTNTIQTYRIVDAEEWETIKADKAANAKTKKAPARTPEEMLEILQKRVDKAATANTNAIERAAKDENSVILALRAQKADIESQIANFELTEHQAKMAE